MTANADTGATRADTTGNGATSHNATNSGASHSVSGTWTDSDDRSWTPPTNTDVRHDRIRWGAVWTGVLTTLSIYIVLQLLFFALGWLDLGVNGADGTTRAIVSGVLALIAFFLGGAAAGASALWHRANDGMVNGVVTWAVTVIALLGIALVGGGASSDRSPTPRPSSSTCAPPAPVSTFPRPPAPRGRPPAGPPWDSDCRWSPPPWAARSAPSCGPATAAATPTTADRQQHGPVPRSPCPVPGRCAAPSGRYGPGPARAHRRRTSVWVQRTLSRHATSRYSCMSPPRRSHRSGRTVAPEGGGVRPAGGC